MGMCIIESYKEVRIVIALRRVWLTQLFWTWFRTYGGRSGLGSGLTGEGVSSIRRQILHLASPLHLLDMTVICCLWNSESDSSRSSRDFQVLQIDKGKKVFPAK